MIAIKNGKVLQPDGSFLDNATVLVEGGQIKAVGQQVEVPADAEIVDATGKWVTPGLIDAHNHISTFNEPNWHRTRNCVVWTPSTPLTMPSCLCGKRASPPATPALARAI